MKYFKVLTLSSLIHSKPSNLNKSNLKQYKRQCISLFICAHLVATPCAYALDNAPQPLEIAQVISSKPHTTQPNQLHSSALVEQIPTPQLIPPQPATLQPTELQSPTPPPISPPNPQDSLLPHSLESNAISLKTTLLDSPSLDFPHLQDTSPPHSHLQVFALLDFTSQYSTLQDSPHSLHSPQPNVNQLETALLHSPLLDSPTQHLQDAHLSYPSLPSLDSSLPSKLKSLDSLPITPDTSTRFLSPSITHSPNNIEIINITTPNAQGISNNHYIDFNIKPKSYTK